MGIPLNVVGNGEASEGDFNVTVSIVALKKSYLILVSDQDEFGVGTVVMGAPPIIEGTGAVSAPAPLFGLKNNMLANMIGKIASQKLKVPVLSLVYILEENLKTEVIMKTTMNAVLDAIKEVQNALKKK